MAFPPRPAESSALLRTAVAPPKRRLRVALAAAVTCAVVLSPVRPVQAAQPQIVEFRDTEIEDILHKDCDAVFTAAGLDPRNMTIHLLAGEMNAMTMSGQEMAITSELIIKTENPNQLIGVMAHESGHAAGGHPLRTGEMERAGMGPMLLSLALGALAIAAGAPDAGAAMLSSAGYFGTLGALTYSREQESRADQAAITYLEKAGLSAKGIVDFFDNFRYEEVFSEARRYPYFQDHPISSERIEALRRRAEEQKHFNQVDSPEALAQHEIIKAKLLAFTEPAQSTFIRYREDDTSFPARYARAIAYYRMTETDRALKLIDALTKDYPTNPYIWELKGQTLFEVGRAKEAEAAHRRSVELKPDAPLLRINLAQAIVAQDNPKRAEEALDELKKVIVLQKRPDDTAGAYRLMAQVYDSKGEPGEARLAAAEERFAEGDKTQARIFAMRARELLTKDTPQWRRATDIVLVSNPSLDDLQAMSRG